MNLTPYKASQKGEKERGFKDSKKEERDKSRESGDSSHTKNYRENLGNTHGWAVEENKSEESD